jgi:hypothetical protein
LLDIMTNVVVNVKDNALGFQIVCLLLLTGSRRATFHRFNTFQGILQVFLIEQFV